MSIRRTLACLRLIFARVDWVRTLVWPGGRLESCAHGHSAEKGKQKATLRSMLVHRVGVMLVWVVGVYSTDLACLWLICARVDWGRTLVWSKGTPEVLCARGQC